MARKNVGLQKELTKAKSLSVDITTFEGKLDEFKEKFGRDYRLACSKFNDAIAAIDKSINNLQTVRASLVSSEDHLRLANAKAEGLTIRKLTYKNPTMKAMFDEARKNASSIEEIKDDDDIAEIVDNAKELDEYKRVDFSNETVKNVSHTTINRKANVGDVIIRTTDNTIGKVVRIETVPNGLEKLILEMEDGAKGSVYNNTKLYQVIESF